MPPLTTLLLIALLWRFGSRRQSLPCPVWLRWLVELDNPFTRCNRAAFIVGTLDVAPGMHVLDAGCGPGRLTLPLARQVGPGGRVVALDLQAGMLARTQDKTKAAGLRQVELLHAALGEGSLPVEAFDRAALVTVLGEIPDQAAALAELSRALRPGGRLAIAEVIFDPHFQPRQRVRALATSAGLQETACFGHRLAYVMLLQKP